VKLLGNNNFGRYFLASRDRLGTVGRWMGNPLTLSGDRLKTQLPKAIKVSPLFHQTLHLRLILGWDISSASSRAVSGATNLMTFDVRSDLRSTQVILDELT